ncbi:helix-hairpin-helix domain-containing protein, partial [Endozoicomonas sp. SESOKO4]|uniref:helix-hairpin-helix domain-containing protein n=1 Tax=Endozoicomonas sp. SESOKO4 TaxID=2828745 RepID=UPI0021494AF5
ELLPPSASSDRKDWWHSAKQLLMVLGTLHMASLKSQIRALSIPQVGESRSEKLVAHFKSWKKILNATPQEIAAVALMSVEQARRAKSYLNAPSIRDSIEWFRRP